MAKIMGTKVKGNKLSRPFIKAHEATYLWIYKLGYKSRNIIELLVITFFVFVTTLLLVHAQRFTNYLFSPSKWDKLGGYLKMSALGIVISVLVALFCLYLYIVIQSIKSKGTDDKIQEMNKTLDIGLGTMNKTLGNKLNQMNKTLDEIKKVIGSNKRQ